MWILRGLLRALSIVPLRALSWRIRQLPGGVRLHHHSSHPQWLCHPQQSPCKEDAHQRHRSTPRDSTNSAARDHLPSASFGGETRVSPGNPSFTRQGNRRNDSYGAQSLRIPRVVQASTNSDSSIALTTATNATGARTVDERQHPAGQMEDGRDLQGDSAARSLLSHSHVPSLPDNDQLLTSDCGCHLDQRGLDRGAHRRLRNSR